MNWEDGDETDTPDQDDPGPGGWEPVRYKRWGWLVEDLLWWFR